MRISGNAASADRAPSRAQPAGAVLSVPTANVPAMQQLTDTETAVLDFEDHWWKFAGAKESAIHDTFAWSPTRHYQVLNELLDRPEALAYAPMLVRRLLRLRDQRLATRSPGRVFTQQS